MLSMTYDTDAAKFSLATPDDLKQASEKALNLWVGATSPLWMPFWAAAGFGISAWAMSRSFLQSEDVLKELPLAAKWPGFTPIWGQKDFAPETLEDAVVESAKTASDVVEAVAEPVIEAAETVAAPAVDAAETAAEPVLDPVAEVPVVPAVAEATAEPLVEAVKVEAKPVAPKAIAKDLAVAKPAPKAKPKA